MCSYERTIMRDRLLFVSHQALSGYTAAARQQASQASSSNARSQALLNAHALVTEAKAAAALAKHMAAQSAVAAAGGSSSVNTQQHFATAVEDYNVSLALLQSCADAGSGPQHASIQHSSSAYGTGKVMLDFGLLCSYLHHLQQQQQQQTTAAAALPGPAGALVTGNGGLAALAVKHVLAAMAAGGSSSEAACLHVPTVLSAMASAPAAGDGGSSAAACDAFASGWQSVPVHVFLPWASQLLARLGSVEGAVLVGTLEALAHRYVTMLKTVLQKFVHFKPVCHLLVIRSGDALLVANSMCERHGHGL